MANYCENKITANVTNCEWNEISDAFVYNHIDWPVTTDGINYSTRDKEISYTTSWSPTPLRDGQMAALSESYPSALFYYQAYIEGEGLSPSAWFCNGCETDKSDAGSERKKAYKAEVKRFVSATPQAADGIKHRVEVMPDGRVAADGENRFGECNIFPWANIKEISCGNWHTVGLTKDGTLVACGSNANGQCNVKNVLGKVVSVSCGRYHTAALLENGKVVIMGKLEQEAKLNIFQAEKTLKPEDFPLICDLQLNRSIKDWEKMNDRIEKISAGDELTLKMYTSNGEINFNVLNSSREKIGEVSTKSNNSLSKMLTKVKVYANTVTPLSARKKGSRYAAMEIRIEYNPSAENDGAKKKASTIIGDYKQTCVENWPAVQKIKSVFDAVIGVTEDGQVFVDGYCPCSEADILKIARSILQKKEVKFVY